MAKTKVVFNPFTGNFEHIIQPDTKGSIIHSVLLNKNEDTGALEIVFDEDSILYVDDEFKS